MTIDLPALYLDLHRNPELSFQEVRTAGIAAAHLRALGAEVVEGIGGTGVAGVFRNGDGPTVWLRADMDGLPVEEQTGLDYASIARGTDANGIDVPIMHACGHDMHVTCLVGAMEQLAARQGEWSGTVVAIFQPAEELATGARAMIDDGLYERVPRPDIVLGQHVAPLPAGTIGLRPGTQMGAAEGITVTLFGRGGHGSRPDTTIDPVVMAAATIMRLQTITSRGIDPLKSASLTVGSVRSGSKHNIIPAEATLELSMRYPDDVTGERMREQLHRIVHAEAEASGAVTPPTFVTEQVLPPTINDAAATARTTAAFEGAFGAETVFDPGTAGGSEDVSWLARDAGVPLVFWFLGGADSITFAAAVAAGTVESDIPSNHSPFYAPVVQPTLTHGVQALTVAALEWLEPKA